MDGRSTDEFGHRGNPRLSGASLVTLWLVLTLAYARSWITKITIVASAGRSERSIGRVVFSGVPET